MRAKLGFLVGLMMAATVVGCGGSATKTPTSFDCSASLSVGTSDYVVSGQYMALGVPPNAVQMTRVSAGSSTDFAVYGVWSLGAENDGTNDGLTALGEFDIEPGMVTFSTACTAPEHNPATATVTSTAMVTASTIEILMNANDDVTF